MNRMTRLAVLAMAALLPAVVFAQSPPPPDCRLTFSFSTAAGDSASFDNRITGCDTWTIVYQAGGYSAVTLTVQSAPGVSAPGAFVTYSGTVATGINPNTSTAGAETRLQGFVSWIRVDFSGTVSAAPLLTGQLYGYKSGYPGGGVSSSTGCVGTVATPCIVAGPAAVGAAPAAGPVSIGFTDGSVIRRALSDSSGRQIVNVNSLPSPVTVTQTTPANLTTQATGAAASGAALAGNPVLIAGSDGTDARSISTDNAGRPNVNINGTVPVSGPIVVTQSTPANLQSLVTGAAASGAALAGNPVLIAGSDGTDARSISTDNAGRPNVNINGTVPVSGPIVVTQSTPANLQSLVTGAAASGAALAGNPVLIAGSDGTDARSISTDNAGRPNVNINGTVPVSGPIVVTQSTPANLQALVTGAAAAGAAASGNPVLVAGGDGTNAQTLLVDTSGRQEIVGAAAAGAAALGNPVLVGGNDGANARSFLVDPSGRLSVNVNGGSISATVAGSVAPGSTQTGAPLPGGGVDSGGLARYIATDAGGRQVDVLTTASPACPNQAAITGSATTGIRIITGTVGTTIHICHIDFSLSAAANVTVEQGTGSVCASSTASLTGAYPNILTFAQDYNAWAPFSTSTTNVDVCLIFSASVTIGGWVSYAQN